MLLSWLRNLPGRLLLALRSRRQHYRLLFSGYRSHWYTSSGLCIHSYRRSQPVGPDQNPALPVVFLHGLLDSGRSFRYLARHMEDRPLVLLDLPGYGRSFLPAVRELWHLPVMARMLYRYLETITPPYVLVTHSMGGLIALQMMEFAEQLGRPHGVARLHMVAPGLLPLRQAEREYRRKLFYPESPAVVQDLLGHLYHARLPEIPPSVLRALCVEWNQPGFHFLAENTIEMETKVFFTVKRIRRASGQVPVHFYWGKEDRMVRWQDGRSLARSLGASFDLLDDCGHAIHLESADRLARAILAREARARKPKRALRSA